MLLALTLLLAAPPSTERLVHAVKLWGTVRYRHPWIYTRDLHWDAAFVRWLGKGAEIDGERASLQALLDELHDPATRMIEDAPPAPKKSSPFTWIEEGVLSIKLEQLPSWNEMRTDVAALQAEMGKARAVILDGRGQPPMRPGVEDLGDELAMLLPPLAPRPLLLPSTRAVMHSGFKTQLGNTSGGYGSFLVSTLPEEIPAGKGGPARVALLVDATTPLPPVALALQQAGVAAIVAEGPIDDRSLAPMTFAEPAPGLRALVRSGELDAAVGADVTAAPGQGAAAALAWVKGSATPHAPAASALPPATAWRPDKTWAEMRPPSREYRLLALARFWTVIDQFYPYKALLDQPWEKVLRDFLPRFEQAESEDAYARAILEMSAQVEDSHTGVRGPPAVDAIRGELGAQLGLRLQLIDGAAVVVEVLRPESDGVRVGDVIEEIDGEPLLARADRLEKYAAASLPLGRRMRAIGFALGGAKGSSARLKLRGGKGVTLERRSFDRPDQPAFRLLPDNVGYADLTRLTVAQVDPMFEQFASTRALVLDMRGYPKGTAWSIAPRINVKGATRAAWFARNLVSGQLSSEESGASFTFQQAMPATDKPLYRGRVVMLIDEFAISQSEHSGLFFEAASDITYVGSPTAGANGDVTLLSLPGGYYVSFTGHDVRHPDGRRLQRVGLQPDVPVRPTLAGIRAGRDEVLERALDLLGEKRTVMPAKARKR